MECVADLLGQCMRADGRADGGFPASDQAVGVVVVHNNPVGAAALASDHGPLQKQYLRQIEDIMTDLLGQPSASPPITQNLTSAPDIYQDFHKLLAGVGLDPKDTGGEVTFTGADPILPSKHRLGAIMALGMMGPAVATQILYRLRGGPAQDLSVDLRKAVAHINPIYLFKPTTGGYPPYSPLLTQNYPSLHFTLSPTTDP